MASRKDDPEFDEFCDPDNPRKIKYEDVLAASRRIAGQIYRTQMPRAHMSEKLGMDVYIKHEFLQYTGSFKERGVRNTLLLLSDEQKKLGVVSASAGNHATALGYHSGQLGIPNIVVMPVSAPLTKVHNAEKFCGKVILNGANMAETKRFAMTLAKEKKMRYVNGYDHPNVVEGQGTIGIEIIEEQPNVDAVVVPCGGGSLLAGIAVAVKHLKPNTEVYGNAATDVVDRVALKDKLCTYHDLNGVESDKTCSMVEALKKNERVYFPIGTTIVEGLAVPMVGVNTFFNVKALVDKMVVVNEDWVARAIMHIVEEEKFAIEGSGAIGIAALMAGLFPHLQGKKVVVICTGGNIDQTTLGRVLERGMAAEGRLVKFKVTLANRHGGLAELCALLAGIGVTVRDCVPERACVTSNVLGIQFKLVCETRGWDHTRELLESIKKHYKEYLFQEMNERPDKASSSKRGPCLAPNPVCMQK